MSSRSNGVTNVRLSRSTTARVSRSPACSASLMRLISSTPVSGKPSSNSTSSREMSTAFDEAAANSEKNSRLCGVSLSSNLIAPLLSLLFTFHSLQATGSDGRPRKAQLSCAWSMLAALPRHPSFWDELSDHPEVVWGALVALVIVVLLTPAVGGMARLLGAVDQPGGRRLHTRPIPRLGGLALFLGVIVPALAFLKLTSETESEPAEP